MNKNGGKRIKMSLYTVGTLFRKGRDSVVIYYGSKEQCSYFRSYINSKFVRFLVLMSIHGVGIYDRETWRFVPAPEAFDHIFTDVELYKKYNLTDEEINIIESIIKERK